MLDYYRLLGERDIKAYDKEEEEEMVDPSKAQYTSGQQQIVMVWSHLPNNYVPHVYPLYFPMCFSFYFYLFIYLLLEIIYILQFLINLFDFTFHKNINFFPKKKNKSKFTGITSFFEKNIYFVTVKLYFSKYIHIL